MGGGDLQQQTVQPDEFHGEPWYDPDHLIHHLPWASITMIVVAVLGYLGIREKKRRGKK